MAPSKGHDAQFKGPLRPTRHLCQAWPSNIDVTEPSSKTSLIAREISGAIESTVSLSK